jgi:hypothetical protein
VLDAARQRLPQAGPGTVVGGPAQREHACLALRIELSAAHNQRRDRDDVHTARQRPR